MTGLFVPDSKQDVDLLNLKKVKFDEFGSEECIVFSNGSKIYAVGNFYSEPFQIAKRDGNVNALAFCGGRIYDGGSEQVIRDTLEGDIVARRADSITALSSFFGVLYDGNFSGEIHRTIDSGLIAERSGAVWALCGYSNFFDGGNYPGICDVFSGNILTDRQGKVMALGVFCDSLYDGGDYEGIYKTFTGGSYVSQRKDCSRVYDLFEYQDSLFYVGTCGGFVNHLDDTRYLKDYSPSSAIVVPSSILEDYLK